MTANTVELLIRARDQAKPDMDALKARLADLGRQVETARADVTTADGAAKLDKLQAQLTELGRRTANPKISMSGALRAEAQVHAVEASMEHMDEESGKSTGRLTALRDALNGLTLGLSGGWGEMSMFQKAMAAMNIATGIGEPLVAGLTVAVGGLAGGAVAAGGALGALGLLAKANLTAASTAATAAQSAQTAYKSSVTAANAAYKQQMGTATTATQKQAAATQRASALQSAYKARVDATTQAYANLTPAQVALSKQVGAMSNQWQGFTASFAPMISKLVGQVRPLFAEILPDIRKLATAGFTGISALLSQMGDTSGFSKFIDMLANKAPEAIVRLGVAIGHIISGIGGILRAFMPVSHGMLSGLDSITAKFAQWGQTLSGHSGFQDLMNMFRSETPQAITVLKQLASIVKIVASQMTGMDTFGNSKMFLTVAVAVTKLVNSLLRAHPELVWLVLYAKLGTDALGKLGHAFTGVSNGVGGIRSATSAVRNLHAGLKDADQAAAESTGAWGTFGGKITSVFKGTKQGWNDFRSGFNDSAAAESAFSGRMGTLGGKVKEAFSSMGSAASSAGSAIVSGMSSAWSGITSGIGNAVTAVKEWSIWSKIAAAATKIWTGVQAAFDAVMDANPLALIIIAIAALVAAIVILVVKVKAFRDFWIDVWHDVTRIVSVAFDWVKAHWPLLLAILTGPIGLAVLFIKDHWKQVTRIVSDVIDWVKGHWPLLLEIITGPIGLAVVFVKSHWREITDAARDVIDWVKSHWPLLLAILTGPIGLATLFIVDHWHEIVSGAERMFHDVVSFFERLPGDILHAVASFGTLLFNAGADLLRGLLHGIESMVGGIISSVEHVGSGILHGIESTLGISSPSRHTFRHGQMLGQGLINGMDSMRGPLAAAARRMAGAALPAGGPLAGGRYGGYGGGYGAAGGGGTLRIQLEWTGGHAADRNFMTWLANGIRANGGSPDILNRKVVFR